MKQLIAFFQKEWMELTRSGKFLIIVILFILFGVMNPALAKLTPWMMEVAAESLAEAGLVVTEVPVDAMTSWTQYYKNIPLELIVFILMFSGILTREYEKKTLINMVTKGLSRWKIVLSKTGVVFLLWTFAYWLCYGITYGYNTYFWDNNIAEYVFFAAFCIYVLGVWLISLMMLMSVLSSSNTGVLLYTGVIFAICYFAEMLVKWKEYLPTYLMNAGQLLSGVGTVGDYKWVLGICVVSAILNITGAVVLFNRKNI